MTQQNVKIVPGLHTLKNQRSAPTSIMPLESHPQISIVFKNLHEDIATETKLFYFQGNPLMRLRRFVSNGISDSFQIQPLFKLEEADKDRFWQIKLILKNEVRKHIPDLDLNKVTNDLWKKYLEVHYGMNMSQEKVHYDYFLKTLKSFEMGFEKFRSGNRIKKDVESEPDSYQYSHVDLFSLIYYLQYQEISDAKLENPSVLDVGCGMGFQLLLFQKLLQNSRIMGTDIDINRFQHAVQEYEEELKMRGIDYKPLLLEKNDFLTEDLKKVLKKNDFPNESADIVLFNHVLEHLQEDPVFTLETLLESTGKILMVSVPFEKVPNQDSGHQQVFGKEYLEGIADKLIKKYPNLKIDLSHSDVGMLIIKKR